MVGKILFFCSNFHNGDFDAFTCYEDSESKKSPFQWFVCVHVCVPFISITQKQVTAKTQNLVFYICIICMCYLKIFIKIGQTVCVQGYAQNKSKTLRTIYGISCLFILKYLDCTKNDRKNIHLEKLMLQLRKGHSRLTHRHLLLAEDEPTCPHCHSSVLTIRYLLTYLNRMYRHYFHSSSPTLTNLLFENPHPEHFNFLKDANFHHGIKLQFLFLIIALFTSSLLLFFNVLNFLI